MSFYQQYLESHLGPTLRPSSFPKGSVYGIFTCIWHYGKCRWIDHTWILWLCDHSGNFRKTWKLFFRSHEMINPLCTNKEHLVLFRENLWRNLSYFRYQVSPEIGDRTTKELPFPDDPCKEKTTTNGQSLSLVNLDFRVCFQNQNKNNRPRKQFGFAKNITPLKTNV